MRAEKRADPQDQLSPHLVLAYRDLGDLRQAAGDEGMMANNPSAPKPINIIVACLL